MFRADNDYILPTPRPDIVEHNSQTYVVFATREEDKKPTLSFINLATMKVEVKIPEALLFLEFTPEGNLWIVEAGREKIKCISEVRWKPVTTGESADTSLPLERLNQHTADEYLYGSSIVTAQKHGNCVTVISQGYSA